MASTLDEEREKLIEHVIVIAEKIIDSTKSRKISIKLRTLLRYAYISYVLGLDPHGDAAWRRIRSIHTVRPPPRLTNQYYYREIERALRERLGARIENRRQFRYVVLYRKPSKYIGV